MGGILNLPFSIDAENEGSDEPLPPPSRGRIKQIWAIGGGKGGVGKSLISSSLAVALSRLGKRVVAVDLDLGGANLHTTLGVDLPKQSLSDFFSNRTSLRDLVVPTQIPNLELISGAQDAVGVANIKHQQKARLLSNLRELDADYLILDLGAGSNFHTIDFFLYSDIGIITSLPEPTSIENAYRFIRHAYYRRLRHSKSLAEVRHLIDMAMDVKNTLNLRTPTDLFREVNRMSPEVGMLLRERIEKFRPKVLINQVRTETDIEVGHSMRTVCKKYFGIEMDYIGHLEYDSAVWQAVRRKRPVMLEFPNSRLAHELDKITLQLIKRFGQQKNDIF